MRKSLWYTGLIAFLFTACETDIESNAEYQDITVVYGLLDQDSTAHYVKINKAFLGEGDANDLASNANNYSYNEGEIAVRIDAFSSAGVFVKSYNLTRTTNEIPKDNGIFDSSTNVLYRFDEPNLDADNTYRLSVYHPALEKEVTAETTIPSGTDISSVGVLNTLDFYNGSSFTSEIFVMVPRSNVGRVKAELVFRYTDVYTTNDSTNREIRINMGEEKATSLQGNNLEFTMNGDVFFNAITSNVPANVPNLDYRRLSNCQVELTLAGVDLSTYMSVNAPENTSAVSFTNVDNGLGLFSSRTVDLKKSNRLEIEDFGYDGRINLGDPTIKKILTLGLDFCSPRSGGINPPTPICWQ